MENDDNLRCFVVLSFLCVAGFVCFGYSLITHDPLVCDSGEWKLIYDDYGRPVEGNWIEEPDGTWARCIEPFYESIGEAKSLDPDDKMYWYVILENGDTLVYSHETDEIDICIEHFGDVSNCSFVWESPYQGEVKRNTIYIGEL